MEGRHDDGGRGIQKIQDEEEEDEDEEDEDDMWGDRLGEAIAVVGNWRHSIYFTAGHALHFAIASSERNII